jgi:ketosteroid isomerase-like protein
MSQENVEVVRRLFAAWNRKDQDTAMALLDPQIEFRSALVDLGQKVYRGHDEMRQYRADLETAWETWETRDERFIAVGKDRVVSLYRVRGLGRGSGVPVEHDVSIVFTVRRAKVTRAKAYLDQKAALEAVGLSEQDAHAD